MYGLEKEKKGEKFVFDLEREIKENPAHGKTILKKVEEKIGEIKHQLRAGADGKDFDNLGILLQGYTALQKVLKKVK
jgi:hypothetical protein